MFKRLFAAALTATLLSVSALADGNMVKAEVVKVDKAAGKGVLHANTVARRKSMLTLRAKEAMKAADA